MGVLLVAATVMAGCGSARRSTAPLPSGTSTSVPAMTLPGAATAPGLNGSPPPDPTCQAATLAEAARGRGLTGTIVAHTCVGDYAAAAATVSGAAATIGLERDATGWTVVEEGSGNGLPVSSAIPPEVSAALSSNLAKAPRTDQTGF